MITKICPNCGSKIAQEDHFCSYCRYPMAEEKGRKTFQEGLKHELLPAIGSAVLGFAAMMLWLLLTEGFTARYGLILSESVVKSFLLMVFYIVGMLFCGAAFHLLLSGFCANSKLALMLASAAVTLVLCLTGAFLSVFAKPFAALSEVSPEYMAYMVPCIRGILIMVPLVQGALFLCAAGREWKRTLVLQVSIAIGFLLLSFGAEVLMIMVLNFGAAGINLAALAASVMTVLIALISRFFP